MDWDIQDIPAAIEAEYTIFMNDNKYKFKFNKWRGLNLGIGKRSLKKWHNNPRGKNHTMEHSKCSRLFRIESLKKYKMIWLPFETNKIKRHSCFIASLARPTCLVSKRLMVITLLFSCIIFSQIHFPRYFPYWCADSHPKNQCSFRWNQTIVNSHHHYTNNELFTIIFHRPRNTYGRRIIKIRGRKVILSNLSSVSIS